MKLMAEGNSCRLYCGDSSQYEGDADLVLTNAYGPIPAQLHNKPIIITNFASRKVEMEMLAGQPLAEIGRWGIEGMQAVWVANLEPRPIDLSFVGDERFEMNRGWWPLDLPLRLLLHFRYDWRPTAESTLDWVPPAVIWDGFMGRGTAGSACQLLGLHFVGIDIDPARVELAKRYLGVE
jgi:hypothetical protein